MHYKFAQSTGEKHPTPKSNGPTEDDTYWKPAKNINELYKQLSASNYRDIQPSQLQYVSIEYHNSLNHFVVYG